MSLLLLYPSVPISVAAGIVEAALTVTPEEVSRTTSLTFVPVGATTLRWKYGEVAKRRRPPVLQGLAALESPQTVMAARGQILAVPRNEGVAALMCLSTRVQARGSASDDSTALWLLEWEDV